MTPEDLVARHGILNALAVHSRAVDRADRALFDAAYHPDATVDYGFFAGPAATLADILVGAQATSAPTLHRTAASWIKVDGDRAISESTVVAHIEEPGTDGAPGMQRLVFGRYLDRHECRDGVWKLTFREYVIDGNRNTRTDVGHPPSVNELTQFGPTGGKGASDPARAYLALYAAAGAAAKSTSGEAQTMTVSEQALADALARAEIHDLLMAYSRGADRADAELLASIFTPDAEVVTGAFNGPASEFAPMICGFIRDNMDCCFHSVANEWIDVRGDEAVGEHYVIAHIVTGGREITTGGRYVDRYQKRDGKWLIRTRSFVNDWTTAADATLEREGFYASLPSWGTRDKTDPVYAAWGQK